MKSLNIYTLSAFLILTITSSCIKENLSSDDNQGVKSVKTNTTDTNITYELNNTLTSLEIDSLISKDEVDISNEVLDQINKYRKHIGLNDLINNKTAKIQALSHSNHQAKLSHMSHDNSSDRIQVLFQMEKANFYGENVAFGYSNIEQLIAAWIKSDSHRENLEGNFTHSGIGTIANDKGVLYFTQVFFK